jgi:hypothetical protein
MQEDHLTLVDAADQSQGLLVDANRLLFERSVLDPLALVKIFQNQLKSVGDDYFQHLLIRHYRSIFAECVWHH